MMVPVSTSTTGYLVHDFFFFYKFLQKLQFCNICAQNKLYIIFNFIYYYYNFSPFIF